jgi:hypothetical protein
VMNAAGRPRLQSESGSNECGSETPVTLWHTLGRASMAHCRLRNSETHLVLSRALHASAVVRRDLQEILTHKACRCDAQRLCRTSRCVLELHTATTLHIAPLKALSPVAPRFKLLQLPACHAGQAPLQLLRQHAAAAAAVAGCCTGFDLCCRSSSHLCGEKHTRRCRVRSATTSWYCC